MATSQHAPQCVSIRRLFLALAFCGVAIPATAAVQITISCGGNPGEDLRAAIRTANASGGGTITMQGCDAVYTGTDPEGVNSALPKITSDITIVGNGTDQIRRDYLRSADFRIFYVENTATLRLENLTVADGLASLGINGGAAGGTNGTRGDAGGAIYNRGAIVVDNVTFNLNDAGRGGSGVDCDNGLFGHTGYDGGPGGDGGAIHNIGNATITNSRFTNNAAGSGGVGGNCTGTGLFSVSRSAGSGGAGGRGGAIRNDSGATLTIRKCFFYNNDGGEGGSMGQIAGSNSGALGGTGGDGGAISSDGALTMEDTTLYTNRGGSGGASSFAGSSGGNGGALAITGGVFTLRRIGATTNGAGSRTNATASGRAGQGGAIYAAVSGTIENLTAYLNTISASCPDAHGAGLYVKSPANVVVHHATFMHNTWLTACQGDTSNGASIYVESGAKASVRNSILYTLNAVRKNCAGPGMIDNLGNNISWSDGGLGAGDTVGCTGFLSADPQLGTRSNEQDGPQWIAFAATSPALNAAANSGTPAQDIRGLARPQGPVSDIGSTEMEGLVIETQPQSQTVNEAAGNLTFTATVRFNEETLYPTTTWQKSTDAGATWNDLPPAFCASAAIGHCTATVNVSNPRRGDDGARYRFIAKNAVNPAGVTSDVATLTVLYGADFVTDLPTAVNVNIGQQFTLTMTYSASPAITTVLWEVSKNGSTWENLFAGGAHNGYFGIATETYNLVASQEMHVASNAGNPWRYRVTLSGGFPGRVPAVSRLTRMDVLNDPQAPYFEGGFVLPTPWAETTATNNSQGVAWFFARGNPLPAIGWQRSTDQGFTWTNLSTAPGSGYQFNTSAADLANGQAN